MEWDMKMCLNLVELYKANRCLWDPTCEQYKNNTRKEDAWRSIAMVMQREVCDARKKMDSLLASFRRERTKCMNSKKSGCGASDVYEPKWFAFQQMEFLLDKYKPRSTINTMETVECVLQENREPLDEQQPSTSYVETPRKQTFKRKVQDERAEEAYKILKTMDTNKDDSTVYGEYVASKHRNYSRRTRNSVEHLISQILFDADVGKFDEPSQPSFETGQSD